MVLQNEQSALSSFKLLVCKISQSQEVEFTSKQTIKNIYWISL